MPIDYQAIYDFDMYRGDDLIKNFKVEDDVTPSFDFTGTTVLIQFRKSTEETTVALQDTPTPTTSTLGEIEVQMNFDGASTSTLEPVTYVYDIQFTLPGGEIRTYFRGKVKCVADVSRT